MKKIIVAIIFATIFLVGVNACEDKDPHPEKTKKLEQGQG